MADTACVEGVLLCPPLCSGVVATSHAHEIQALQHRCCSAAVLMSRPCAQCPSDEVFPSALPHVSPLSFRSRALRRPGNTEIKRGKNAGSGGLGTGRPICNPPKLGTGFGGQTPVALPLSKRRDARGAPCRLSALSTPERRYPRGHPTTAPHPGVSILHSIVLNVPRYWCGAQTCARNDTQPPSLAQFWVPAYFRRGGWFGMFWALEAPSPHTRTCTAAGHAQMRFFSPCRPCSDARVDGRRRTGVQCKGQVFGRMRAVQKVHGVNKTLGQFPWDDLIHWGSPCTRVRMAELVHLNPCVSDKWLHKVHQKSGLH